MKMNNEITQTEIYYSLPVGRELAITAEDIKKKLGTSQTAKAIKVKLDKLLKSNMIHAENTRQRKDSNRVYYWRDLSTCSKQL